MEEDVKGLGDYLDIIRRRKYWVIFPALILMAVSVGVAKWLPATYKSEGLILIESQEIPHDLVRSTVTSYADQRIEIIRQRLLTTNKVLAIVKKHNLYVELRQKAPASAIVNLFKENIAIRMVRANVTDPRSGRAKSANIAFRVSFMDKSPVVAQIVANEVVTEFLNENVRTRTQKASETTRFLRAEGDKFQKKIQQLEKEIAEFKDEYSDSLPELLQYNLSMVEGLQEELAANQNQVIILKDQVTTMTVEMANINAYLAQNPGSTNPLIPSATSESPLVQLKTEYNKLLGRYSENHPDVLSLKRQIEALEKEQDEVDDTANTSETTETQKKYAGLDSPIFLQIKSKIKAMEREIIRLKNRQRELTAKITDYEQRIYRTHQVKRAYDDMTRDHENNMAKYRELRAKLLDAELGEHLESEDKAESFTLIDPPRVPSNAEKPDRPKIMAIGGILSIGAGVGFALLIEMLFGGVRGYNQITHLIGQAPLVVVPVIKTKQDHKKQKTIRKRWLFLLLIALIAMVIGFHFLIMDLEVLWFKVLRKLGSL